MIILREELKNEAKMDLGKIDRIALKAIIKEILKEDISLFKDVVKEVLLENQIIASKEQGERRKRLENMIDQDFDKYSDVFKSLA